MVRVYSIPNCPYCTELKNTFIAEGVEFVDINVNLPEHQEEYQKLYEFTKCEEVPIIRVGKQILLPNTSFTSIRQAADLTKGFVGESN